jgi:hypothetical protein
MTKHATGTRAEQLAGGRTCEDAYQRSVVGGLRLFVLSAPSCVPASRQRRTAIEEGPAIARYARVESVNMA